MKAGGLVPKDEGRPPARQRSAIYEVVCITSKHHIYVEYKCVKLYRGIRIYYTFRWRHRIGPSPGMPWTSVITLIHFMNISKLPPL